MLPYDCPAAADVVTAVVTGSAAELEEVRISGGLVGAKVAETLEDADAVMTGAEPMIPVPDMIGAVPVPEPVG